MKHLLRFTENNIIRTAGTILIVPAVLMVVLTGCGSFKPEDIGLTGYDMGMISTSEAFTYAPSAEPSSEPQPINSPEPTYEPTPEFTLKPTYEPTPEPTPGPTPEPPAPSYENDVERALALMTMEQKVLQLFMITPEALTGVNTATVAGDMTKKAIEKYPVGGIIYFAKNLTDTAQTESLLKNTKKYYAELGFVEPFLAVDEEGGRVARIGGNASFNVQKVGPMRDIGDSGNPDKALEAYHTIGTYLSELGFNMDMAPDADVISNPKNTVIGDRSFGTDATTVSLMVQSAQKGLKDKDIVPVLKHFPGHGATEGDTHEGYAYTMKTLEELMACELVPFAEAIKNGAEAIMAAHIAVPGITGDNTPCTLSNYMLTEVLRNQMGFDGLIITDAMNMGAIKKQYDSKTAAVEAVKAGADIVLMPDNFAEAYTAVLEAVQSGELSTERIDASVRRILKVKL